MSIDTVRDIAIQFGLSVFMVQSWIENKNLKNKEDAILFFSKNISYIKAIPFVKWVGGKRQLIEQFQDLFPKEFNDYFEPFLGGGAVFFNLQKKKSYLSDMNEELINVYTVIKNDHTKLLKFLKEIKHSKETYLQIRSWDREENWLETYSQIERAGRFIYLNRTCFNGLHRVNSRGEFNVPMGVYKNPDYVQEINITNVAKLLHETETEIQVQSFEHVLDHAKTGDFIYFDPPYDSLTETANFTSYNKDAFGKDMQVKLAETFKALSDKGCQVMLSNHNTPFIRDLYKDFKLVVVKARRNINRDASGRGLMEEIVVINY